MAYPRLLAVASPLAVLAFNPFHAQNQMANYFFTDANGNKQGPLTAEQLQTMAKRGTITPDTPLTTDTGHTGVAG